MKRGMRSTNSSTPASTPSGMTRREPEGIGAHPRRERIEAARERTEQLVAADRRSPTASAKPAGRKTRSHSML